MKPSECRLNHDAKAKEIENTLISRSEPIYISEAKNKAKEYGETFFADAIQALTEAKPGKTVFVGNAEVVRSEGQFPNEVALFYSDRNNRGNFMEISRAFSSYDYSFPAEAELFASALIVSHNGFPLSSIENNRKFASKESEIGAILDAANEIGVIGKNASKRIVEKEVPCTANKIKIECFKNFVDITLLSGRPVRLSVEQFNNMVEDKDIPGLRDSADARELLKCENGSWQAGEKERKAKETEGRIDTFKAKEEALDEIVRCVENQLSSEDGLKIIKIAAIEAKDIDIEESGESKSVFFGDGENEIRMILKPTYCSYDSIDVRVEKDIDKFAYGNGMYHRIDPIALDVKIPVESASDPKFIFDAVSKEAKEEKTRISDEERAAESAEAAESENEAGPADDEDKGD